jgi:hypothetical protein
MPKCGGISFRDYLKSKYPKSYFRDYDFPIHFSEEERIRRAISRKKWNEFSAKYLLNFSRTDCIHGHFLPIKYEYFYETGNHSFVTWLRDPIKRIESHYNFWKHYHHKLDKLPLLKRFLNEDWSIEKFALSEEVRNIYSMFLWNFPIDRFDFIGITEFFEEDLRYFGRTFFNEQEIQVPKKNVNEIKDRDRITDPGLMRELKDFHACDYKLYSYALELRSERIS